MPPPASLAVPVMLTGVPIDTVTPVAGDVIIEVGGSESVDGLAGTSPGWSVAGCTFMSASRFTVA